MARAKLSICFVAPNNYAVLSGREDIKQIGGAEVQRMLVARELATRGHDISFVTHDHGQPDGIVHNGIRVYKMCSREAGLPILRFFHPRWSSLCDAMTRASADIYIQRTAGVETGQTAWWCRRHGKRFILSIANDPECDRRLGGKRQLRERWFYRYGLKRADHVIAQTHRQRQMLAENFGINATVIRSCAPDPGPPADLVAVHKNEGSRLLWIGRFSAQKRLDRLLSLAERCTDAHFDIVGGGNPPADIQASVSKLSALPNVTLHGFIPYGKMNDFYRRASLLLSTSAWEGYPNVFIEAWSRGIPVVSTIDPDDVIMTNGLGAIGESTTELRDGIHRLLSDETMLQTCSHNARRFFVENHTIASTGDGYERVLAEMMK